MSKDRTSQIGAQRIHGGEEASTPYPPSRSPQRVANPWAAIVEQFGALPPIESKPPRYNPRPPGVIRPGSATEAVLDFLRAHPGRFFPHHRIVAGAGRSKVATDWALAYLREQGLVEAVADSIRNPRYRRYRAAMPAPANTSPTPGREWPALSPGASDESL